MAHSKNSVKEKEAQKRISKRVLNDIGENGSGLSYDEILLKFKSLSQILAMAHRNHQFEFNESEYNRNQPENHFFAVLQSFSCIFANLLPGTFSRVQQLSGDKAASD